MGDREVRGGFVDPQGWDVGGKRWLRGCEAQRAEWQRDHAQALAHGDAQQCRWAAALAAEGEA